MRVSALQAMQNAVAQNAPGAIPTIRRISRSLKLVNGSSFHPEVVTLAKALTEASDKNLAPVLAKILPRLEMLSAQPPAQHHRILVVEDDRTTICLLEERLRALHHDVIIAQDLAAAKKALSDGNIAFVLLDLQLPDGDGRELLMQIRENSPTFGIPIFVVSSERGNQVQTECFALGADAYFQKPFDPVTLATAVASRLQRASEHQLRSSIDSLTGLPTRPAFTNGFKRAALLSSRSGEPLSVALLDVDRFKAINDLYGHCTGDEVLKRFTSIVGKSLRASDFLARWGGEEFAVFFPNTSLSDARLALQKARRALRTERFAAREGRSFQITFSAGIVKVKPGETVERAIMHADRFLYMAKSAGRDCTVTETDKVSMRKTVLVVEDDDITAAVIKRYLNQDGFKVIRVKKGENAFSLVSPSISLMTLDVKMPGLDGFTWLQRFRKIPAMRQVPIIMLTSAGKQEDILRGFQLGADDYIVKPFSPNEFLARIHRFLEKT